MDTILDTSLEKYLRSRVNLKYHSGKPMKTTFIARVIGLFLSLAFSLPHSAFALKPAETKEGAGLGELDRALRVFESGDPNDVKTAGTRLAQAVGLSLGINPHSYPPLPLDTQPLGQPAAGLEETDSILSFFPESMRPLITDLIFPVFTGVDVVTRVAVTEEERQTRRRALLEELSKLPLPAPALKALKSVVARADTELELNARLIRWITVHVLLPHGAALMGTGRGGFWLIETMGHELFQFPEEETPVPVIYLTRGLATKLVEQGAGGWAWAAMAFVVIDPDVSDMEYAREEELIHAWDHLEFKADISRPANLDELTTMFQLIPDSQLLRSIAKPMYGSIPDAANIAVVLLEVRQLLRRLSGPRVEEALEREMLTPRDIDVPWTFIQRGLFTEGSSGSTVVRDLLTRRGYGVTTPSYALGERVNEMAKAIWTESFDPSDPIEVSADRVFPASDEKAAEQLVHLSEFARLERSSTTGLEEESLPQNAPQPAGLEELKVPTLYPVLRKSYSVGEGGGNVTPLAFNPAEKIFLFGNITHSPDRGDTLNDIWAYRIPSGELVAIPQEIVNGLKSEEWPPRQAVFSPNGRRFYLRVASPLPVQEGKDRQQIIAYDWDTGHRIGKAVLLPGATNWHDMAVSPDGKTLYALFSSLFKAEKEHFIRSFNPEDGSTIGEDIFMTADDFYAAIFPNTDGRRLHVYLQEIDGLQKILTYDLHARRWISPALQIKVPSYVGDLGRNMTLSADGRILYVGAADGKIFAYDLESTEESDPLQLEKYPQFLAVDSEGVLTVASRLLKREREETSLVQKAILEGLAGLSKEPPGVLGIEIARGAPPILDTQAGLEEPIIGTGGAALMEGTLELHPSQMLSTLWNRINLLPEAQTEQASVGVIAGPADPRGWAYGVALLKRARTATRGVIPVVFLVEDEGDVDFLRSLGVSPEMIFRIGSADYPTQEIALREATDYLHRGLEIPKTNIIELGVSEKISPIVEQVLANLFGIHLNSYAATQWKDVIDAVVYTFRQA